MSSVKQTIPSGLYAALEKATAQFPLKALQSGGRAKLDKIMPSFQRKPSQLDTDQGNAKTINFDKIVLLLNGLHTSTLFERHVAVLEKLSVALQRGGIVRNV